MTRPRWGFALVLALLLPLIAAAPAAADVRVVVHGVHYTLPDVTFHAAATPSDFFAAQWGFDNAGPISLNPSAVADSDIDVPDVWHISEGAGVKVAVVDTQIYTAHPDLSANIDQAGAKDFVGDGGCTTYSSPTPDHGTHIAGIVAAAADNAGVVGVAPQAQIVPIRALDNCGSGTAASILPALDYAATPVEDGGAGAQVVVGSFATPPGPGDEALSTAFADLMAGHPDTLFVFAAGNEANDNDQNPVYPCNAPAANRLCVGASDAADGPSCTSNFGHGTVDLFAPGEKIFSTTQRPAYSYMDGTSAAAPMVAGAAALIDAVALANGSPVEPGAEVATTLREDVDPKRAMATLSVAGGRLNAARPLVERLSPGGGNPEFPCDKDHDGLRDAVDDCPDTPGSPAQHGCPPDVDADGVPDSADDCPATANATQANADGDGLGDACDPTPRGPDSDGDGFANLDDRCPTQPGTLAGCPAPPPDVTPPPVVTPPAIAPVPLGVVSVRVSAHRCKAHGRCKRTAKVQVTLTRTARTAVTVQKRVTRGHRRVWKRVKRRSLNVTARGRTLTVRGLRRGTYRVTASVPGAQAKRQIFRI